MEGQEEKVKNYNTLIYIVGAVLTIAVALIYVTPKMDMSGTWMDSLPALNASINGSVSILLIFGLVFIKRDNMPAHRFCMSASLGLSALFLISYVAYHITHESTVFGGEGTIRTIYLIVLLTHILFAMVIAPLVLITFTRALSRQFDKHRKIARITYPMWLYVSVSGVIVYLMIAPYY
jgi:putative membrane protein